MEASQLPTASDLAKLPRRAIVAFAARCARAVLPIFELSWPDAPTRHVKALEDAVRVAEAVGAGADLIEPGNARHAGDTRAVWHAASSRAVRAAAETARSAVFARDAAAFDAYARDAAISAEAAASVDVNMQRQIVTDWVKIRDAAVGWDEDVSVPPSFFDPIETPRVRVFTHGRDGRRRSVESDAPVNRRALELVLEFPNDASDDEITQATAEVVSAADSLHRAQRGHGLVLDSLQAEQPAASEVPA